MPAVANSEQGELGLHAQPSPEADRAFRKLWIVEDNAQTNGRQSLRGVISNRRRILLQVHTVARGEAEVAASAVYRPGELARFGRAGLALDVLDELGARSGIVVAGTNYGTNRTFIPSLLGRGMHVAVEVHRDSRWRVDNRSQTVRIDTLLESQSWTSIDVVSPETGDTAPFVATNLGVVRRNHEELRAFAFAPGSVIDPFGDLRIGVTSLLEASIDHGVLSGFRASFAGAES